MQLFIYYCRQRSENIITYGCVYYNSQAYHNRIELYMNEYQLYSVVCVANLVGL